MKNGRVIAAVAVLLLFGLCVTVFVGPRPDPKDLSYWLRAARDKDCAAQAARGDPESQFFLGLSLVRTNLVTMIDRVPWLSEIPLIGRRFVKVTYAIDDNITQEQLAKAFRWIEMAAERGHAPAMEARRLFSGRVVLPVLPVEQNGHSTTERRGD